MQVREDPRWRMRDNAGKERTRQAARPAVWCPAQRAWLALHRANGGEGNAMLTRSALTDEAPAASGSLPCRQPLGS